MKLLTLNTHSLVGEDAERRAAICLDALCREAPDVIALQEVNQSVDAPIRTEAPSGFTVCEERIPLRQDLYALSLAEGLAREGLFYHWTWLPVKLGYGRYHEGLAFLCRTPIAETRSCLLSRTNDDQDWRRRMALMIRAEGSDAWFCNLHMSWWQDEFEPFVEQWERLKPALRGMDPLFLCGDLNNPAELRGEGYDRVTEDGFYDCYLLTEARRGRGTARGDIDGWHGRIPAGETVRIDQIWCNRPCPVTSYRTVFDGEDYETVSDHFGVMITVREGAWWQC